MTDSRTGLDLIHQRIYIIFYYDKNEAGGQPAAGDQVARFKINEIIFYDVKFN